MKIEFNNKMMKNLNPKQWFSLMLITGIIGSVLKIMHLNNLISEIFLGISVISLIILVVKLVFDKGKSIS